MFNLLLLSSLCCYYTQIQNKCMPHLWHFKINLKTNVLTPLISGSLYTTLYVCFEGVPQMWIVCMWCLLWGGTTDVDCLYVVFALKGYHRCGLSVCGVCFGVMRLTTTITILRDHYLKIYFVEVSLPGDIRGGSIITGFANRPSPPPSSFVRLGPTEPWPPSAPALQGITWPTSALALWGKPWPRSASAL